MATMLGSVADTAPEGFLARRVHFTTMVRLDEKTTEGILTREIQSAGFGSRSLPIPIDGLGEGRGHYDTVPVGRVDALNIDGHNVEGWGWMVDNEAGLAAYNDLRLGIQRGNSVVLGDAKATMEVTWDEETDEPTVDIVFTQANLVTSTLVMKPAFASAAAELEEIKASLEVGGDLEVTASFTVVMDEPDEEITAATTTFYPHEAFTITEPSTYQTISVSRDGRIVSGHLGRWDSPHTGWFGKKVYIPRSKNHYADYCKSPQPTDKGTAYTGPIVLLGGHEATSEAINKAIADAKNIWANVVVIDGRIGPWMCGVVLPDLSDAELARARSARVSGHWLRGELYAICSTPVEGFNVPRSTKYVVEQDADGEVEYLAASFAIEEMDEEQEFAAFGSHKTATVKGTWDAGAQEKNVTSPNTLGYFGRIYAWQKPEAKAVDGKYAKTDMGFPHHMVGSDGAPGAANLTGCSAAIGRLNGGAGGADRQGIYNHIASHMRDGGAEPPKLLSMEEVAKNQMSDVLAKIDEILEDEDANAGDTA